jgi:hypothetical protein
VGGYDWLEDEGLDGAFCLTFARGIDEAESLRRFGVDPATLCRLDNAAEAAERSFEQIIVAGHLDGWVFVLEENGFEGSRAGVLRAVSAGTEVVSVCTNVHDSADFHHAVDGAVRTGFDPYRPARRWGTEPDALLPLMAEAGLAGSEDTGLADGGIDGALRLADRMTGVHLTAGRLAEPVLSGRLVPLLGEPPQAPSWLLRRDRELMTLIDAADPGTLRRAVVVEARRRASDAGIDGEPAVARTLAAAERGETGTVPDDSELGLRLREWACESNTAGLSLATPTSRHLMTERQRQRAFLRHAAGLAVQAAFFPDPRRAAYEVFDWVVPARDEQRVARRTLIVAELRRRVSWR